MNLIKIASISLLTLAVAACGGGGSPTKKASTAEITETITGTVTVGTPNVGNGSAGAFQANVIAIQVPSLSAGGITNITASVVDITKSNELISSKSYAVIFSSNCEGKTPAKASFTPKTVITTTGAVSTSYKAIGCAGQDAITATLYDAVGSPARADTSKALALATGNVTVATAEVGAVSFVSNSAGQLGFAGVGNGALPSTSTVTFNVKDNFGNPLESKEVDFTLSATSAGASLSSAKGVTDATGSVATTLNAGTTHGLLSVVASTTTNAGAVLRTASTPVSVSTGLAEQSSFEITADIMNPAAYDISGASVNITVRATDHFNNPIPIGTTIHFTAESGSIPATCVTTDAGGCTVAWVSTGTRPGQFDVGLFNTRNDEKLPDTGNVTTESIHTNIHGITTITAYALGEGGFSDKNSNGVFDIGEKFLTFPEVYRDDNYDGSYDGGAKTEDFFELIPDEIYTAKPAKYQGALCSAAAKADGHCANLMYVSDSLRLTQSQGVGTYSARYFTTAGVELIAGTNNFTAPGRLIVVVTDENGNIPPATTKIGFSIGTGFTFVGGVDLGNVNNGIFSKNTRLPVSRGALVTVDITKTGTPAPALLTPIIEYTTTKNKHSAASLTIQ